MKQNGKNQKNKFNNIGVAPEKHKLSRRAIMIIIASLLVLALAISGAMHYIRREIKPFDYLNEDLDKYIYISDEHYHGYKGYEIEIAMDKITDDTVQTAINNLLFQNRSEDPVTGDGVNGTIEVGDKILLYFQGFRVNENGEKGTPIEGMSNFTVKEDKNRTYNIGEGVLDKLGLNLELKLLGLDTSKFSACDITSSGAVKDSDIVFLTYKGTFNKNNNPVQKSGQAVKINLADTAATDAVWGEGFSQMLIGQTIGVENNSINLSSFSTSEYDQIKYDSIKVDYVMRKTDQNKPIFEIKTTIPCTNSNTSLQGEDVIVELYIDYIIKYKTPVLSEEFIKETLEIKDETLEKYEGNDSLERFRAYVYELLEKKDEAEIAAIRIQGMWSHYYSIAQFKALPEDEIKRLVNNQKKIIEEAYESNNKGYSTLDAFANAYIASVTGSELVWTDYLKNQAESEVKEKLIFYYVARKENLLPSDEQFTEIAERIKKEDTEYLLLANGIDRDDYETDEAYEAACAPYRQQVEDTYADEELLRYTVHLEYAEEPMSKLGVVKLKENKNPAA